MTRVEAEEAEIVRCVSFYGGFGDVLLREDRDGETSLWNSGHAAHIAATLPHPPAARPFVLSEHGVTTELCRKWRPDIDEEKAKRLDLDIPIIVADLPDRAVVLVGWWRLYRAASEGIDQLPAIWLHPDDPEGARVLHLTHDQNDTSDLNERREKSNEKSD